MKLFKNKSELPEYASHYGMHRPPFSKEIEEDMYYAEPTRTQRLDILLHLTRYSKELLIVTGEKGSGKTAFMQQFINKAEDNWQLCKIDGHASMNAEQFLQRIYNGYGLASESEQKNALLANLRKNIEGLLKSSAPVVLVIDNAHTLSVEVLSLVLDISTHHNQAAGNNMRVVLFCEPQIKILLAEPELGEKLRVKLRKIDLPPLDEYNIGHYLRHRLSQSGMEAEQFLTAATVNKIYLQSEGIPSQINDAADKILYDTTPIIRRTSYTKNGKSKIGIKQIAAIGGILSLVLAGLLYIEFGETTFSSINNNIDENTTSSSETSENITSIAKATQEKLEAERIRSAEQAREAASSATTVKVETDEEVPFVVPLAKSNDQKTSNPQNKISKPKQTQNTHTNKKTSLGSKVAKDDQLKDANWLLAQEPQHFTLQLVAGHHKTTITRFMKKYPLQNKQRLAYFFSNRNGKPWHNLLYGVYPSHQSATKAMQDLPISTKDVKPWIRRLKNIQTEISNTE